MTTFCNQQLTVIDNYFPRLWKPLYSDTRLQQAQGRGQKGGGGDPGAPHFIGHDTCIHTFQNIEIQISQNFTRINQASSPGTTPQIEAPKNIKFLYFCLDSQ